MSTTTIHDGGLVTKDPSDVRVYTFDWDTENGLPAGVTIASQTCVAAAVRPSDATALTVTTTGTGLGIQTGNRTVQVKVSGGQLGALYTLTNQVTTDETPAQVIERSFSILIENR